MSAPQTANDVYLHLAQLGRDLDANVAALESAELDAVAKRHDADTAEAKAFLSADGAVDSRKRQALLNCERLIREADVAEAVVRHLKRRGKAIETRIDVGRSFGANMRAEAALAGRDGHL
jgi:hypothetical protein